MPKVNRRRFLQVTGAAGLAPLVPALPARAAVAGTATTSQMLWASLFARAGNAGSALEVAKSMGVSRSVAKGIFSKLAHANILAAPGAQMLGHVAKSTTPANVVAAAQPAKSAPRRLTRADLRKWLEEPVVDQDSMADEVTENPETPEAYPKSE